jgi:hypothetical protein
MIAFTLPAMRIWRSLKKIRVAEGVAPPPNSLDDDDNDGSEETRERETQR